jgi:hypothetical protein
LISFKGYEFTPRTNKMDRDTPKTRKESKKSAKDKASGKDTCYSSKRVRQMEAMVEKNNKK